MTNSIEEKEKAILLLIDLYLKETEKDRLYFLKYKKNNPNSGLEKEPFISFYNLFKDRADQIEITDFLYQFGILRAQRTFHLSSHAESLINNFDKLGISIPHFVLQCKEEIIHRDQFIKHYFENGKFKFSDHEKHEFLKGIQNEAKTNSFDKSSEKEYLKKKFEEAIQKVKDIEKEALKRFGYYIDGFFDGEYFQLTKEGLNEYFFHSEIASNGYESSFEVFKVFSSYIKAKNELSLLREYLAGETSSKRNPFESIWVKKPKVSTDDFLKKGIDLGLWDENYNLLTKRGAIYGSGKTLLANISIALKNHSINEEIDYKIIGEVFCSFFKIEIKNSTNPYKAFQAGNEKQIKLLKKVFE